MLLMEYFPKFIIKVLGKVPEHYKYNFIKLCFFILKKYIMELFFTLDKETSHPKYIKVSCTFNFLALNQVLLS